MALFARKRTTVGLDIGSGLMKLVAITHGPSGPVLTKVHTSAVAVDAIVEGEVMDTGLVADAIKGLLVSAGLKPKSVVIAVGGRDVIIKKITMERVKEAEARQLIRWEAEQHVPFDMENVELDFQILDPEGDGLQMEVLLVAAKRELVENKMTLLAQAGVTPSIIDVDAFALHNAFELNHPDAMTGVVGLVNIGHETTNVNILEDGIPVLNRDLPIGTRRFREDLQRERGLSAEEADKLLQGFERNEVLEPFLEARGEELARRHRARGGLPPVGQPLGRRTVPAVHLRRRRPDPRAQSGAGRPAAVAGTAWPTRWNACRCRKKCSQHQYRRGRPAADAADRPRPASAA